MKLDSTYTAMTAALTGAMDAVRDAGMPGLFAEVRRAEHTWRLASGVADVVTDRPAVPELLHRMGSISKTFVAVAILQYVEAGELRLDDAIGRYLPTLVPDERGDQITIRMLLSHTSGLAEYLPYAYPSLQAFPVIRETTPDSLEENRYTRFDPVELIELGVAAPPVSAPGGRPGVYSNTNYLLLCRLVELVSASSAEECITGNVIAPAGLPNTGFPSGPQLREPHSRMYESWFGMHEPARDYSVFDMSWVGPAASLVSTVADLNRFYAQLLSGAVVGPELLAQMQRTGPVISFEGTTIDYGLGLHRFDIPGHGTFWGHDGTAWGASAISMTSADAKRQFSLGLNLTRYNRLDESGKPQPHPIDAAFARLQDLAVGTRCTPA